MSAFIRKHRKKLIAALVVIVIFVCAYAGIIYVLSEAASGLADWVSFERVGGCLSLQDKQRFAESIGEFQIPDSAEQLGIDSQFSTNGSCYIVARFVLPEADLDDLLASIHVDQLSNEEPNSDFWIGAAFTDWPLIQGTPYLTGSRNFRSVVYDEGVIYLVVSITL